MNKIDAFVKQARKQIGKPYVWATAGPDTFDCSGLVYYCVNQIQDPDLSPEFRSSQRQWEKLGKKVAGRDALREGDLMFWGHDQAEHVGIWVKDGIINALNEDAGVVLSGHDAQMGLPYLGVRRLFSGSEDSPKAPRLDTGVTGPVATVPTQTYTITGDPPPGTPWVTSPVPIAETQTLVATGQTNAPSMEKSKNTMITSLSVTTPFRSIGDVTLDKWREVMKAGKIQDVEACYYACVGYSALALAQAYKESSLGNAANSIPTKNPLGLMDSSGSKLVSFASYPLAFADFRRRVSDPAYKGSPGPYYPKSAGGMVPGYDMSILAYLITYVGGPDCLATKGQRCANGETYDETKPKDGDPATLLNGPSINLYTAQTLQRLRDWLGLSSTPTTPTTPSGDFQKVTFAPGITAYLPKTVLFRTVLTPVGPNRPGASNPHTSTTQHETGNTKVGANANMHSNWQDSGTPGHPDGYVGVHFYVDDDQIIQKIPVNETSIHSGDWRNGTSISVERCVNADQTTFADSETNAAWLQAALLKYVVKNSAKEAMYPHYLASVGSGTCPTNIGYHWQDYENRVDSLIGKLP